MTCLSRWYLAARLGFLERTKMFIRDDEGNMRVQFLPYLNTWIHTKANETGFIDRGLWIYWILFC